MAFFAGVLIHAEVLMEALEIPSVGSQGVIRRRLCARRAHPPLMTMRLLLPGIRRCCYFAPFQKHAIQPSLDLWPEGYNQCHPLVTSSLSKVKRGGMFLVAELAAGGFVAVLPLVTQHFMTWMRGDAEGLLLEVDHWGSEGLAYDHAPVLAWALAAHPYEAADAVWELAAMQPELSHCLSLRRNKKYPTPLEYLGWCTWEEYRREISEEKLILALEALAKCRVPVRWVLIDDGHIEEDLGIREPEHQHGEVPADEHARKLRGLGVNRQRFPNGWAPVVQRARQLGFRWLGVWINFNGYWGGIGKDNSLGDLNQALFEVRPGVLQPRPDLDSAKKFYTALVQTQAEAGFDFIKVDNQAGSLRLYQGTVPSAVAASSNNHEALEAAASQYMLGMINCMAHNNVCLFNTRKSAVTRCSEDYLRGNLWRAKHHLSNSFFNMLWMRQTIWGDHDMFHSSDAVAAEVMARSKAISGGPIYLSDAPEKIRADLAMRLCYEDGRILRAAAPAVCSPESLFHDSYESSEAFRVLAPVTSHAAAVILYNITDPEIEECGAVQARDFEDAMRLADRAPDQNGLLLAFRWRDCATRVLTPRAAWRHGLPGFGDELFWLTRVREGWSVLGRADKFLGPAALGTCSIEAKRVELSVWESGPLLVWHESRQPRLTGGPVPRCLGEGLWLFDLPVGKGRQLELTIP